MRHLTRALCSLSVFHDQKVLRLTSLTLTLTLSAAAHQSPEHDIKHLTKHIKQLRTSTNLHKRALAYRATGQLTKATADLREAIILSPGNLTHHLELSHIHLANKKPLDCLKSTSAAEKLATTPTQRASLHILRAEALLLLGKTHPALTSIQLAFKEAPRGEIEWFILRSELQLQLGQHQQRITDLKHGHTLHHSAVLKSHWIDALIDAGKFNTALTHINTTLTDRRFKSSWLIKRARCHIGLNQTTASLTDLQTALTEITSRLNPSRPDPLLLTDLGITHALLGNTEKAQTTLQQLKLLNSPPWITKRLETLLKN